MTLELLLARKQELINEQQKLVANANALNGAIQDTDYWISVLNAPKVIATAEAPTPAV